MAERLQRLQGAAIFIVPYCHADWAWTHTRHWHEERYTLVFNEVLDILNEQDKDGIPPDAPEAFRWYLDTVKMELEPFLLRCPERLEELRKRIAEGRVAVCGGYANVRINHVEGESFLRSLILGRREFKRLFPEADLSVFADIVDVAVGHPQLPQILRQAGYRYLRFWRPQAALSAKGIPYEFIWEGMDGSQVIASRGCYGGLLDKGLVPDDFRERWEELANFWWEREIEYALRYSPTKLVWLSHGMDDARPLRQVFASDEPLDLVSFVREWNCRQSTPMRFATPLEFYAELERRGEQLPVIKGSLDPCDVCYNAAWNGEKGLWALRWLCNDALLVAETLLAVTHSVVPSVGFQTTELEQLWKNTLTFSAHATQWLFQHDFDELYALAQNTLFRAKQLQRETLIELTRRITLPPQTAAVVFNPLPFEREVVLPILLSFVEGDKKGVPQPLCLLDGRGKEVPYQTINEMWHASIRWEVEALVRVWLPPMGWNVVRWEQREHQDERPPRIELESEPRTEGTDTLENEFLKLEFHLGRLVSIIDKTNGREWRAPERTPFGHLRVYEVDPTGVLHVGPIIGEQDAQWERWEVAERGRVRQVFRSVGRVGANPAQLDVRLYAGERSVEFAAKICWQGMNGFLASHLPLPSEIRNPSLFADMPFCVEAKDLTNEPYGRLPGRGWDNIERMREGMFIARTFVDCKHGQDGIAYVSHNGDRYYIFDRTEGILKHILINSFRRPKDWEKDINRQIEGEGEHEFVWSIIFHDGDWKDAQMWRVSSSLRTPPLIVEPLTGTSQLPCVHSFASVSPANVVLSALYGEDDRILVRVYETAGESAEAIIQLPFTVAKAQAINLIGEPQETPTVRVDGNELRLALNPWQIATVVVRLNGTR